LSHEVLAEVEVEEEEGGLPSGPVAVSFVGGLVAVVVVLVVRSSRRRDINLVT
jgi:hypothetical protein